VSELVADPTQRARDLEQAGDVDGAWRAWMESGRLDEAVRLLCDHNRPVEGADLILARIAHAPRPFDANTRAWAMSAASLFESAGVPARAAEVLAWIGANHEGEALAKKLLDDGRAFDAGACLVRLGDPARGIELLTQTSRDDDRYGSACVEVAHGLARGAAMTMELDRWLAEFIRRGPDNDVEAEALYTIAAAFAREGFPENAVECLIHIEQRRPGFRDAAAQARRLEAGQRSAVGDFARVLDEDALFSGTQAPSGARPPHGGAATIVRDDPQLAPQDAGSLVGVESFAPGVVLGRRYRLDELIGKGGMSLVYRATDLELQDTVALKIFTQPTNEDALARFKQEVLLARQLIHRNVVRVYDLGTALGARFLTMELLVGEDLHSKLVKGLTLREGIDYLIQACAGLEAAHQAGVVHRDIKPENLFVTRENVVKVTDFGIAKQGTQKGLTVAGMVVGTPEYMAPEQAHGHMTVTAQADLYSLGIILYYLCTKTLPFRHAELMPLLMMQVTQRPEPPRKRNPSLPPDVEELVMSLLEKDASLRPPTARAVGERLIDLRLRGVV
jgi:serine/threonine-protein kinase